MKVIIHAWCITIIVLGVILPSVWAETAIDWYQAGELEVNHAVRFLSPNTDNAKNVILFIGDGMGISTVTAARIFAGQLEGKSGEENELAFERLPYLALSKTYNTNQQTPDSAGTMSAIMTGIKTKAGFISVSANAIGSNCVSAKGNELSTFLEQAEMAGLSTGIVSTARLTHATPAATYAHTPAREWESDGDMPARAKKQGCRDIARQLIEFSHGNGLEVALGGGRSHFFPSNFSDLEDKDKHGKREDGRNLVQEWLNRRPGSAWVWNKDQFDSIDPEKTDHLLGLFNYSHMQYEYDRRKDSGGEPSLSAMTVKAIDILQKNHKGFFLMVEGGRIDHAHHDANAFRALHDTVELARAVEAALHKISLKDTLLIVTADHSHVLTIAGYPTRGNPILDLVRGNDDAGNPLPKFALASDNLPYTTLSYANGPQSVLTREIKRDKNPSARQRQDLSDIDTTHENFHQPTLIPMVSETHGAEDVAIYAGGPWAHLFRKTHEQNYIYHVMRHAIGFKPINTRISNINTLK